MNNRVGVCCVAFKDKTPEEIIVLADEAGADGVEIWAQPPHVRLPVDKRECEALRNFAASRDVEILALGSYYRPGSDTVLDEKLTPENQIALAKAMGIELIRILAGNCNFEDAAAEIRSSVVTGIQDFADLASRENIGLVLERHGGTLTNTWESPSTVLNLVDRANTKLNYQMVHPASAQDLRTRGVADYKTLLGISSHAHIQNFTERTGGDLYRCFLDEGLVDYSGLGAAASASGYSGAFMVEFLPDDTHGLNETEALRRDITYLKSCLS